MQQKNSQHRKEVDRQTRSETKFVFGVGGAAVGFLAAKAALSDDTRSTMSKNRELSLRLETVSRDLRKRESELAVRTSDYRALQIAYDHQAKEKSEIASRLTAIDYLSGSRASGDAGASITQNSAGEKFFSETLLSSHDQMLFIRNRMVRAQIMELLAEADPTSSTAYTRPWLYDRELSHAVHNILGTYIARYNMILLTGSDNYNNHSSMGEFYLVPFADCAAFTSDKPAELVLKSIASKKRLSEDDLRRIKQLSSHIERGGSGAPNYSTTPSLRKLCDGGHRLQSYYLPNEYLDEFVRIISSSPRLWTRILNQSTAFISDEREIAKVFELSPNVNTLANLVHKIPLSNAQFWDAFYKQNASGDKLYTHLQPQHSAPHLIVARGADGFVCVLGYVDVGFSTRSADEWVTHANTLLNSRGIYSNNGLLYGFRERVEAMIAFINQLKGRYSL